MKEQSHLGVNPRSWWEWSLLPWAYKSLPQLPRAAPCAPSCLLTSPPPSGEVLSLSVRVPLGPQAAALSPPVYKEVIKPRHPGWLLLLE